MTRSTMTALAICFIAASSTSPGVAEISAELRGGYQEIGGAAIGAAAGASFEKVGSILSLRLSGWGEGTLLQEDDPTAEGRAIAQLSASLGSLVILGSAEGGGYNLVSGEGWICGGSLSFSVNGFASSVKIEPRVLYDSGPDGSTELGGILGASFLLGTSIVKPELDLAWETWPDDSAALRLVPSLGLSWYPGAPFSARFGAGFERSWPSEGGTVDSVLGRLALYGAAGRSILWSLDAEAELSLADLSFSRAEAEGEISFLVARFSRGELGIPLAISWSIDPDEGFAARAGLRISLE